MTSFFTIGDIASVPTAFLLSFPALFSIVNPLGGALIFAQVTAGRGHSERSKLAARVGFYSMMLLLVSLWAGSYVLSFFGITLGALRIAGGLVVAVRGWGMLNSPELREATKREEAHQDGRTLATADLSDVAFFPLSLPFTVGPGSISVAIALGAAHPGRDALPFFIGISIASVAVALIVWATYSYADLVVRALGETGSRIVTRLVALILLAIGVQIVAAGVQDLLLPMIRALHLATAPPP
jgi:multiple antibiotic resistance protein